MELKYFNIIMNEGIEAFNQYRKSNPNDKVTFTGIDFKYAGIKEYKDVNFKNVNLSYTNFSGCDFSYVYFTNSDLKGSSFSNCDFSKAIFSGADLKGAKFSKNCNFSKADFTGTFIDFELGIFLSDDQNKRAVCNTVIKTSS